MAENKTNGTLDSTAMTNGEERPPADAAEALAMAEEAEAEAAEAEALAAAARARARAIRLRRKAEATASAPAGADEPEPGSGATATEVLPKPDESGGADVARAGAPEAVETEAGKAKAEAGEAETAQVEAGEAKAGQARLPRSRRPLWAWVALGLVGVLICALLAGSGWMIWLHHKSTVQSHRSAEFAAAARQGVVSLLTMDFNHAKEDVQRVVDNSTGQFRDDFQSRADDFTKVVQDSKVITKGSVNATAVQSMTDNSAVVLVAASSQVTNATGAQNEPRTWRLSVSEQTDGGQIKMSKVEFVP